MFDFAVYRLHSSRTARIGFCVAAWLALGSAPAWAVSHDLAVVPLFDGQRSEFLNTWGGAWGLGSMQSIRLLPADPQSGRRVLCVELGQVPAAEHRYLQCFASGFGPTREYYQTRNLARYERLHLGLRNMTHAALRCAVQVKDYRDSKSQSATYRFELPATEAAVSVEVPLALAGAHWTVKGHPDLSRVLTIDFLFEPCTAIRSGRVCLSDVSLVEPGGPVDIDTSPLPVLVERLARRQWDALWSARSRSHGMIPNNWYQATDAGLNTTAAVLWMLPAATRRGWVQQADADRYVESLVQTIDGLDPAPASGRGEHPEHCGHGVQSRVGGLIRVVGNHAVAAAAGRPKGIPLPPRQPLDQHRQRAGVDVYRPARLHQRHVAQVHPAGTKSSTWLEEEVDGQHPAQVGTTFHGPTGTRQCQPSID